LEGILNDNATMNGETITRALISQGSAQADGVPVILFQTSQGRFMMQKIEITNSLQLFKLEKPLVCQ